MPPEPPLRHAGRPRPATARLGAVLAVLLAGCGTSVPSSPASTAIESPGGSAAPGPASPTPTRSPGDPLTPGATPGPVVGLDPMPSGWPDFPGFLDVEPDPIIELVAIPEPTMTNTFEIGVGLFDPAQVAQSMSSILALMGVGIRDGNGDVVRAGDERDGNDLWLTEDEVRGLIDMGIADAMTLGNDDTPATFGDLAAALEPLLPEWPAERLASAYDAAYADRPDDLIAGAMLGQPIEVDAPMSRTQLWLLYVDGFVAPSSSTALVPGAEIAAGGIPWGTANASLPSIPPLDPALATIESSLVLAHLMLLAYTIPFAVDPFSSDAHEGHGAPGPTLSLQAAIDSGNAGGVLVSPFTGLPLVLPRPVPQVGGLVTWSSPDEALLAEHGSVGSPFGIPMPIGGSGSVALPYAVREEPADRTGPEVFAPATVRASMSAFDLVNSLYAIPPTARGFLMGSREVSGHVRLSWHAREGINLTLLNMYDIDLIGEGFDFGFGGSAHGVGQDAASGFLEKGADGVYRGTMFARSLGTFSGEWGGSGCTRLHDSAQLLYVIGRPISGGNLQLAFYPASTPWFWFPQNTCPADPMLSWQVGWEGGGPDNRPPGAYIPFGTGRWTSPLVGYSVWLPSDSNPEWVYEDDGDSSEFGLVVWRVRSTLVRSGS